MTTVGDILNFVETLAPRKLKMDWDNVGLLCGRPGREVRTVLLALDPFQEAAEEAAALGAELLLTHHSLIFRPCYAVNEDTPESRTILFLAERGIAAINAHTNLDFAPGGVNDVLAERLGLREIEPLPCAEQPGAFLLRAGEVPEQTLEEFLDGVKAALGTPVLRYVSGGKKVRRVAVGGGACMGEWRQALAAGCDTLVTSDLKYNDFWTGRQYGMNLIDAGHFYTENPVVSALAEKLRAAFPAVSVKVSEKHKECMKFW